MEIVSSGGGWRKLADFIAPIGACWSFERIFLDGMFSAFWNISLLFFFFFWISRFEIGQFFPLQPRLWIISEGDFAVDEFLNFPSL